MGLDMYLFKKQEESVTSAGYWRKANQVHAWFVKNVQNGVDNCGQYPVPRQKLEELSELCQRVLQALVVEEGMVQRSQQYVGGVWVPSMVEGRVIANPEVAHELLPAQEGFFFGGTDYDEYYIQDLEDTVEICRRALADDGDYCYQASW